MILLVLAYVVGIHGAASLVPFRAAQIQCSALAAERSAVSALYSEPRAMLFRILGVFVAIRSVAREKVLNASFEQRKQVRQRMNVSRQLSRRTISMKFPLQETHVIVLLNTGV